MSAVLWSSVIAVVGTLCGGVLAGVLQARLARAARRETRCDVRRGEALAVVTALVSAVADHRRALWVREELRLSGAGVQALTQARGACHSTRSAITGPLVTVRILTPALAGAAQQAVSSTYAMRDSADVAALAALRVTALAASDCLIEAASQLFMELGVAV